MAVIICQLTLHGDSFACLYALFDLAGLNKNSLCGNPQGIRKASPKLCLLHVEPYLSGRRQRERWSYSPVHQTACLYCC